MNKLSIALPLLGLCIMVALNVMAVLPAAEVVAYPSDYQIAQNPNAFPEADCWICCPVGSCGCPGF